MNRIDRLTAMIIYLQGRQRVTVGRIAERYQISNRTVYRDLKALQEAGVPIGFESGKGYYIVRGYHLPPVMFSKEEAAAMLAGERLMQKWSDTALGESYQSALDKIRGVLPAREKEYMDTLDQHLKAFPYPDERAPMEDSKIFVFLQDAIVRRKIIAIEYYSPYRDDVSRREVEPLGLLLRNNRWYLAAWCRLRIDYRMFRIDRIESYRKTGEKLPEQSNHSLKEFSDESLKKEQDLKEVTVLFDHDSIRYMGDQKYYRGWVSEKKMPEGIEMTFLTTSIEYFARWLLMWGESAAIQKPALLKERVAELSKALYKQHVKQ